MRNHIENEVRELENVIFVCFGQPRGQELPQVETEEDVIAHVLSDVTGVTCAYANARLHHQVEDDDF